MHSIGDALMHLTMQEKIDGFTCHRTRSEVQARKQYSLESLPLVLVLHLKRFVYDAHHGTVKLRKHVSYGLDFEVDKGMLEGSRGVVDRSWERNPSWLRNPCRFACRWGKAHYFRCESSVSAIVCHLSSWKGVCVLVK